MSRFFVGQRVRLVRCIRHKEYQGMETRIVSGPHRVEGDWAWEHTLVPAEDPLCRFAADWQLEPILPEGAAPSEFKTLRDLLNSLEGVHA